MVDLHFLLWEPVPYIAFVCSKTVKTERLEVDPSSQKGVDLHVVTEAPAGKGPLGATQYKRKDIPERPNSENFIDDPDVPPLM